MLAVIRSGRSEDCARSLMRLDPDEAGSRAGDARLRGRVTVRLTVRPRRKGEADGRRSGKNDSSQAQADEALQSFADGFSWLRRAPVLHSPSEHGLEYEDVSFPARDGVPLDGWFIPAPGSSKL